MPDSSETGETGGKKRYGQGQGSHVTRVSLLALVARAQRFRDEPIMNHAGWRGVGVCHWGVGI